MIENKPKYLNSHSNEESKTYKQSRTNQTGHSTLVSDTTIIEK